jgi:uncharacterized protein YbjT (DUF2867 family)
VVAGATGLVGREVLAALLADNTYSTVHSLGRRKMPLEHAKLNQHVVDFQALGELPRADDVFIALGTTIQVAGSQAAFRAIDFDAVVALAGKAQTQGASRLGVVSAMGASPSSSVFYNRVKGDMEAAVSNLGYASVVIVRPSMLAGQREALGQPVRQGERVALWVTRWLSPVIPINYRSVQARDVAHSLIRAVQSAPPGVTRLLSGSLQGQA